MNSNFLATLAFLTAAILVPTFVVRSANLAYGVEAKERMDDSQILDAAWMAVATDLTTSCLANSDHTEALEKICECTAMEEVKILSRKFGSVGSVPKTDSLVGEDTDSIIERCMPLGARNSRRLTFN